LKDLLVKAEIEIRRLLDENMQLNERISEASFSRFGAVSPISNYKEDTDDLRR